MAARRSGDLLAVSFTDTADHDRSPVELALRASQAAERAAQVATCQGPDHVYQLVNPRYQRYFPTQALLGRSIREVIPKVGEQGIFALLPGVYQTGEPYTGQEVEAWIDFSNTGHREQVFLNLFFYPLRDAQGRVDGVLDFSYDVTEQVRARQRVQELNQARQASNDELAATNRQLTRTNVDLDDFIYTASHDLKQPIANIEGLLDALGEHLPAAARQEALVPRLLALMRQAVERFQLTLHQLTDLMRLQQAHAAPAEAVDPAATVEAVRLALAPLLARTYAAPDAASPALILLDVNMPVMSGAQFLEAYQQLPAAQQRASVLVLLTATVHEGELARLRQLPVAGLVSKTLTRDKVEGILQQHFQRQQPPLP